METTGIASSPISTTTTRNESDRIASVARQFESIFTSMMLKAMRKTVGEGELFPTSTGEKIYTGMLDDEYAAMIGNQGTLGLAELIEKQLRSHGESGSAADITATPAWMIDSKFIPSTNRSASPSYSGLQGLSDRLEPWNGFINQAAAEHGIDRNLVAAIVAQESGGNPYAVSRAGAKGLMQLMDSTAASMGVASAFDPQQNIGGGVRYLRSMLDKYDGNIQLALASYNAGPGAVDKYNGIPPYRETQDYVRSVMALRSQIAAYTLSGETAK